SIDKHLEQVAVLQAIVSDEPVRRTRGSPTNDSAHRPARAAEPSAVRGVELPVEPCYLDLFGYADLHEAVDAEEDQVGHGERERGREGDGRQLLSEERGSPEEEAVGPGRVNRQ